MLAGSIAPTEVRDGEPHALATLCAVGAERILAYCTATGADVDVDAAAAEVLATFRRTVADDESDETPLERLLLETTRDVLQLVAKRELSLEQRSAAEAAFSDATPAGLSPEAAADIIDALVAAAPVTAFGGDAEAVREATALHYSELVKRARGVATVDSVATASWVPRELLDDARRPDADTAPRPPGTAEQQAATAAGESWLPAEIRSSPTTTTSSSPAGISPATEPSPSGEDSDKPSQRQLPRDPAPLPRPKRRRLPIPRRRSTAGRPRRGRAVLAIAALAAVALAGRATAPPPVQEGAILVRAVDVPFTASGAVFQVARTRTALWAKAIRRRAPRPGQTWITLAAQTRNVRRDNLHPRALGYRIRTNSGIVIGPETAQVATKAAATGGRLPIGARASVHLGFQVPQGSPGLSMEFDPGPGSPRIRVPLS